MWAIGFFEGEGCLGAFKQGAGEKRAVKLIIVHTDLDVLERFHRIAQCGYIQSRKPKRNGLVHGAKAQWEWDLTRQQDIDVLLTRMMPYLGQRRKERAQEIFDYIHRDRSQLLATS